MLCRKVISAVFHHQQKSDFPLSLYKESHKKKELSTIHLFNTNELKYIEIR